MTEHAEQMHIRNQQEEIDVLREIRNEINTPELRDRIAMAVLQGGMSGDTFWLSSSGLRSQAAEQSYKWADAMLEAREK